MKKAFTAIELIFVIVILGILTSIMLPKITSTKMEQSQESNSSTETLNQTKLSKE